MRSKDFKELLRRVLGVVLSCMLVLSMCPTAGFAEQIEATPEDEPANEEHVLDAQGAGEEGRLVAASTAHAITVDNKTSDFGTVAATLGGASTSQAAAGDTITVIATPADSEQYTLDKLTVAKTSDPNTTVNINYDNTFTMPDYDVTVTASFRERHVHDDIEFEPWKSTADNPLPKDPGAYYLTGDVTLTTTWNVPCGGGIPTHLCLNGQSTLQVRPLR